MKKISCAILFWVITTYTVKAQFYARAGLGYGMPQAGQTLEGNGNPYNGSVNNGVLIQTFNIKSASFSAGLTGTIGLGYMFSEHIGAQLDGSFGLSTKKYTFKLDSIVVNGSESNATVTQQCKSPFIVTPSLVLKTGEGKLGLYTRIGVALPLNSTITMNEHFLNLPGTGAPTPVDLGFKIKNSFSPGFAAAAGITYKVSDRINIWGEVSFLSLSLYIKESDVQSFSVSGQSYSLTQLQSPPLVVKYSKNAQVDSNGANQPTYSQPFSNVGIHVGASFNLSEKRTKGENHFSSDEGVENKKPFKRR